jgi:transcriptional regulator with XRE-family HTH domain
MTMTEQPRRSAQSTIELPCLQEDPESKVGMLPDLQDLASPLPVGPGYVAETNSTVAREGRPHDCRLVPTSPTEIAKDIRPTVKRLWLELTDPDRPCDSVFVDYRVGRIRYLEKLMRTEFASTADLRHHIERCLNGHDGRRLPVPQAIRRARRKLKLSQNQLAELLGLKDHTLISKYESAKRVPSDRVLEWLRQAENVTGKESVNRSSQAPRLPVTSDGGKEASISPNMGESETSQEPQNCTPDDSGHPAPDQEVL